MQRMVPLWVGLIALGMLVGCRGTELIDPEPITVDKPGVDVRGAIMRALPNRGWWVESESPGAIIATVTVRGKHKVTVNITYTPSEVRIKYHSSEHMKYHVSSTGRREIHKNYMTWVSLLRSEISSELSRATYGS